MEKASIYSFGVSVDFHISWKDGERTVGELRETTDVTRGNLVDAFCILCRNRPVSSITVKEVAAMAGYSRATFYNYFPDVYALLEYVEEQFIADALSGIRNASPIDADPEQFILSFVEMIGCKEERLWLFTNPHNSGRFLNRLKEEAVPLLMELFQVREDDIKARYALEFYASGLIPLIGTWLRNDREMPVEDLALLVRGILQEGVIRQFA